MVSKVLFSSESEEWQTPKDLYQKLNNIFNFDLDPCTTKDNPLKTPIYYTKEDDGLTKEWWGNVFINPPYNKEIEKWLSKSLQEITSGYVNYIVLLLPARTDTKWFHTYIYDPITHEFRFNVKLWFLKGRLKFGNSKNSAPFPSMIVIFRKYYSL